MWFNKKKKSSEQEDVSSAKANAPVQQTSVVITTTGGLTAERVAVITAAAFSVAGQPVRIRRITPINQSPAWAEVGRISIHSSHNVRRSI